MNTILNGHKNCENFAEAIAKMIEDRSVKYNKENSNPLLVYT